MNLRDERIVGFKANDIEQNQDRIDRMIIMDYMENGSLQNYLNHRQITEADALKLISTLIQGNMICTLYIINAYYRCEVFTSRSSWIRPDCFCCASRYFIQIHHGKFRWSMLYFRLWDGYKVLFIIYLICLVVSVH